MERILSKPTGLSIDLETWNQWTNTTNTHAHFVDILQENGSFVQVAHSKHRISIWLVDRWNVDVARNYRTGKPMKGTCMYDKQGKFWIVCEIFLQHFWFTGYVFFETSPNTSTIRSQCWGENKHCGQKENIPIWWLRNWKAAFVIIPSLASTEVRFCSTSDCNHHANLRIFVERAVNAYENVGEDSNFMGFSSNSITFSMIILRTQERPQTGGIPKEGIAPRVIINNISNQNSILLLIVWFKFFILDLIVGYKPIPNNALEIPILKPKNGVIGRTTGVLCIMQSRKHQTNRLRFSSSWT